MGNYHLKASLFANLWKNVYELVTQMVCFWILGERGSKKLLSNEEEKKQLPCRKKDNFVHVINFVWHSFLSFTWESLMNFSPPAGVFGVSLRKPQFDDSSGWAGLFELQNNLDIRLSFMLSPQLSCFTDYINEVPYISLHVMGLHSVFINTFAERYRRLLRMYTCLFSKYLLWKWPFNAV